MPKAFREGVSSGESGPVFRATCPGRARLRGPSSVTLRSSGAAREGRANAQAGSRGRGDIRARVGQAALVLAIEEDAGVHDIMHACGWDYFNSVDILLLGYGYPLYCSLCS